MGRSSESQSIQRDKVQSWGVLILVHLLLPPRTFVRFASTPSFEFSDCRRRSAGTKLGRTFVYLACISLPFEEVVSVPAMTMGNLPKA
jgi:hypothetical protein